MPRSLIRNEIAAVLPVPGDKRTVFVVPWGDFTYVGTTDTDHDGSLDDPRCTDDDVAYLLRTINASLAQPIGARRHRRRVGRAAAARRRDAQRPWAHQRSLSPPPRAHRAERAHHRDRGQAHHLPAHGAGIDRPSDSPARSARPSLSDQTSAPRRRRTHRPSLGDLHLAPALRQ